MKVDCLKIYATYLVLENPDYCISSSRTAWQNDLIKTLATTVSAYVSDHQQDWDRHLPYVLMASRSSLHESTGYSLNMLMLGREVRTALDLMYELPSTMKPTIVNEYV